jgi:hypothetical protein
VARKLFALHLRGMGLYAVFLERRHPLQANMYAKGLNGQRNILIRLKSNGMKFFGATKPGFNQASIHVSELHRELERKRYIIRTAYKTGVQGRLSGCFGA